MKDSFNEINITPLTDIFLVLLIIMMVIAPLLDQQGLNLTVPENVQAENQAKTLTDGLLIQSDPEATHGAVVKLMDSARNAGVTNISVVGL